MSTATNCGNVLRYPRHFSLENEWLIKSLETDVQKQLKGLMAEHRTFKNGDYIFTEGEPFSGFVEVNSGALKSVICHPSGGESITGFYYSGDLVGWDAICSGIHACNVVSIGKTIVTKVDYQRLKEVASHSRVLQEHLLKIASQNASNLLLRLQNQTAEAKMAAFLLGLSATGSEGEKVNQPFELLMPRKDVANYLGMAAETVSRLFHSFQDQKVLSVDKKKITFLDVEYLKRLAKSVC